jgi:hypothetical protein
MAHPALIAWSQEEPCGVPLQRPMVDAARTTDVLNPEYRPARLIHPTKLQVL